MRAASFAVSRSPAPADIASRISSGVETAAIEMATDMRSSYRIFVSAARGDRGRVRWPSDTTAAFS